MRSLVNFIALSALLVFFTASLAKASSDVVPAKQEDWAFEGITGTFDRQSIQRGFKVYREVCGACHAVNRLSFRNLQSIGFTDQEVTAIAGEYTVTDGPNDDGEMFERPAFPSDYIPAPYANEKAARAANNGAYPPDLSLIIKARFDGSNYVYSLLTGYSEPPHGFTLGENMHYNPYFAGGGSQLAMTPPLTANGQVAYTDGTEPTVDQMAKDVVHFLHWAAEPEMEERKGLGIKVIIFVAICTLFFFLAKRSIWKRLK